MEEESSGYSGRRETPEERRLCVLPSGTCVGPDDPLWSPTEDGVWWGANPSVPLSSVVFEGRTPVALYLGKGRKPGGQETLTGPGDPALRRSRVSDTGERTGPVVRGPFQRGLSEFSVGRALTPSTLWWPTDVPPDLTFRLPGSSSLFRVVLHLHWSPLYDHLLWPGAP